MRAAALKPAVVILTAGISGCSTAEPPPPFLPPALPTSFDGNYRGTIRVTRLGISGGQGNWCDTSPVISLFVRGHEFSYVLAHPNLPQSATLSPTFSVAISANGSFNAPSDNLSATMTGRIIGPHMAGQVNGTGCGYAFSAEKQVSNFGHPTISARAKRSSLHHQHVSGGRVVKAFVH